MAKKIGVLTSGGDAPGMNAALRAIVRSGIASGLEIYGINYGYQGLIDDDMQRMNIADVGDIIHRGGTVLKTARSGEFKTKEGLEKAAATMKARNLDALVVIGGDGTLYGAKDFIDMGFTVYHLPATIDNDLGYTDYTIGFDTAVNTVLGAVNNIRETGMSHDKTTVIEVMGRECGDIALRAGLTGGADAILIPEVEADMDSICKKICDGMKRKKKNHIIVRAEGAVITNEEISQRIKEATSEDVRIVILGYLQRGGSPTAFDRMIATLMGTRVIELIVNDEDSKALAFSENKVCQYEIAEAVSIKREPDLELLETVDILA